MATPNASDNLETLYAALTPVLARASVGDFAGDIDIDPAGDPRVNELLVGVQVLLDVINEQAAELKQRPARHALLLDEVLESE
jgi:hypothetical protein